MMRARAGLIRHNLHLIKNTQWYHQHFDASPHFIFLISMAELTPEARKFDCHATSHFGFFERDKSDWYIDMRDIQQISRRVLKRGLGTSHFSKKLMKRWSADEAAFYAFCKTLDDITLEEITNRELKRLYEKYIVLDLKFVTSSSIIDGFALGTDYLIQQEIKKLLKLKGLERQSSRFFAVLTAPIHYSFINEVEVALLKIAEKIEQKKSLANAFRKKPIRSLKKMIENYPDIRRLLRRQEQKYYWSKNNYIHNNYLDVDKWLGELKSVFLSTIDVRQHIRQIVGTPEKNRREKRVLLRRLNPSKRIKVLLEISEDFTHWQDERKKMTYWSTHYGSNLLREIGRRFGFTLAEMKYCAPPEVPSLFTRPLIAPREARARRRGCFWYQKGAHRYEVISGPAARTLYREVVAKDTLATVNDFRGLSACRGVVRGPVKIIKSATETKKVKAGDILVAVMTRPDYIAGMKKAAAIVTNEGGVTCHAAIVSRELGIPCVIGTKIATEVVQDGDIVEVNGNHGVVTIIKRK